MPRSLTRLTQVGLRHGIVWNVECCSAVSRAWRRWGQVLACAGTLGVVKCCAASQAALALQALGIDAIYCFAMSTANRAADPQPGP